MADSPCEVGATEKTVLFRGCRDMARCESHAGAANTGGLQNRSEQPGRLHRSPEQPVPAPQISSGGLSALLGIGGLSSK